MPVRTYEATTDGNGNVQFADAVRLPANSKVCVVVPEQTTPYTAIVPEADTPPHSALRFPLTRIKEEGLAKRLVKTVVDDARRSLSAQWNKGG